MPPIASSSMIDFENETTLSLTDAAHLLPHRRAGKKAHASTLYRWASQGFRGTRLEVIRIGSTLCTSHEALQRFFDRITEADPHLPSSQHGTPKTNDKEQCAIERELDELGIGD